MVNCDNIIYWDNAATTRVDQRVVDSMMPYFTEFFGNASSNHHFGKVSKLAIENAREQVAKLINSNSDEIIFTSGATESINLALKGFIESNCHKGNHIITVKTEHKAVIATCEYLEQRGIDVTYLSVDRNGLISIEALEDAIKPSTILISVMYVNNEIGVIQPIQKIGQIARNRSIAFFCDATQAIGKVKVDVEQDNIDMLAFSGHKINGPKGVGVLFKRKSISIQPLIHGGSQEGGLRAGTYNTPLIVGLGKACELIQNRTIEELKEIDIEIEKVVSFFNNKKIGFFYLEPSIRVKNIILIKLINIYYDEFVAEFGNEIMISNGSACNSGVIMNSHVMKEIGMHSAEVIRISL